MTAVLDSPTSTIPALQPPALVRKAPGILRVIVYARISKIGKSNSTNTTIQVDECLREIKHLAKDRGVEIILVAVFQEDDRSASKYSNKPRPMWDRTVELVEGNWADMVVSTEMERLTRRPNQMSVLIDHADAGGDLREIFLTSDDCFDLTTENGIYRARQAVALSERESNKLSKRTRRKEEDRAKAGFSHASRRTYAFTAGNRELDKEGKEYEGLREAGKLRIKGYSVKEIAYWMNQHDYRTTEGKLFTPLTIRNMLRRVRYAPWPEDPDFAIRDHKGNHYKAQWKPVWTPDEWEQLQLIERIGREKNKDRPKAKKYLLTGHLFCGGCGMSLNGENKRDKPNRELRPVYHCRVQGDTERRRGCGGVTIGAVPLEDFVLTCLFYRLDTPDLGRLFDKDPESGELLKKLLDDRAFQELRIKDILKDYGRGDLTRDEMLFSKSEAKEKLDQINQDIDRVSRGHQANALIPVDKAIKDAWFANESIQWRRGIIDLAIDKIIIHPGGGKAFYDCQQSEGRFRFDRNRVDIKWKI